MDQESMQLKLTSQLRHRGGGGGEENTQNTTKHFYAHTRRAEWLALSQQGSHPAKFQQERNGTSTTER